MSTPLIHLNKFLVASFATLGMVVLLNQPNRAVAFDADCPTYQGTIGSGPGEIKECIKPSSYFDHYECQTGTTSAGADTCCEYQWNKYYCKSGTVYMGMKGTLISTTVNGECVYFGGDPVNERCFF